MEAEPTCNTIGGVGEEMKGTTFKLGPLLKRQKEVKEGRVLGHATDQGPLKRKEVEIIEVKEFNENTRTTKGEPIQ